MPNGSPPQPAQEIIPNVRIIFRQGKGPKGESVRQIVAVEIEGHRFGGIAAIASEADVPRSGNVARLRLECLWPFQWVEEGHKDVLIATRLTNG